jgi:hypothetical protein
VKKNITISWLSKNSRKKIKNEEADSRYRERNQAIMEKIQPVKFRKLKKINRLSETPNYVLDNQRHIIRS